MNTNNSKTFSIIGCGRLGTNLAVFLSRQGFVPVAFASKQAASARKVRDFVGAGDVFEDVVEAASRSDIVFITTPDTGIEPVCKTISDNGGFNKNATVYHLSGALSSDILKSASETGAKIGSIHPLQAFAPYKEGQDSPFKGINISIEGDDDAVALGREIVNALKANSFTIPTHAKTVYHASAVVASNYLVTLEHFALALLKEANLTESDAYEILEPLILGTLNNIKARGSVDALTGPVARGDSEIVLRHLNDIDEKLPQFSDLYRLLGKYTLDIARQRGEISRQEIGQLAELFKPRS
jgi:predicted short-subunit dehydrogenase-like oxidoreductase (DUF2520 family)